MTMLPERRVRNRLLGLLLICAGLAIAIFGIFTSQAWNIFLGFYQSLKNVPYDLREASSMFQLSSWQRFWRVEVPFAMPSLIWNMMMSMSGSWFFIVASEAISVNNQKILLPGIGSYISVAIQHMDKSALIYAIITMFIVILLYDQLLFRPLVAWSEKFKADNTTNERRASSLFIELLRRTRLLFYVGEIISIFIDEVINFSTRRKPFSAEKMTPTKIKTKTTATFVFLWYITISAIILSVLLFLLRYIFKTVPFHEFLHVITLGAYTATRVVTLIIICSLIWVPIGVWVGMRPKVAQVVQPIAQFFAAFPANLIFPAIVIMIIRYKLNINIWTSPLMILGTQWYILFNIIAGTTALPEELMQVTQNFSVKRWLWWKRFVLPGIFPYFITGAISAAGGAWNASIVAEIVSWGNTTLKATGLGAYISEVTSKGDFPRLALGIATMCLFVLIFNRIIWQPLYNLAEKRFQLA